MSYGHPADHRNMLLDARRNGFYRNAIRQAIDANSVVMDLGAGLGVLGFIALDEGAAHVVMVEPTPVLEAARLLARDLGVEDRVTFVQKQIERVPAGRFEQEIDVIVSVFTGNFLLGEDLLPSLFDARDRFLKPSGVMLPDRAIMEVAPVDAPTLYAETVESWTGETAGFDVSRFREYAANSVAPADPARHDLTMLAEPAPLKELDFATTATADCDATATVDATRDGTCHGLLGWFQIRLGDAWLSTAPDAPRTHWVPLFLPFSAPVAVKAGDRLDLAVTRPQHGEWTWRFSRGPDHRRQSTFLSRPMSQAGLRLRSPGYRPLVNQDGRALGEALTLFDGGHTAEEIAQRLRATYPGQFSSERIALDAVKSWVARYGDGAED